MRKILILLFIVAFFITAYASKPDEKTCIIKAVAFVWGRLAPTANTPMYYNQFMDVTSKSIEIKDWTFFKQIKYEFANGKRTVAIGAFKKVFPIR